MSEDDMTVQAGEYVLGTLDKPERQAFTQRLNRDAAARAAVEDWRARLSPLLAGAGEVTPPPATWRAIERRIGPGAANDNRVSPWWRGVAIAATMLAVVSGGLALRPTTLVPAVAPPAPAGASYVAAVTAGGTQPALLVTIDAQTGEAVVRAVGLTAPARKSLELWYIGAGHDPKSLGLVSGDARMKMPLANMIARGDRLDASTFAITAEPMGGAPGGLPTGAILYSGHPMPVSGT